MLLNTINYDNDQDILNLSKNNECLDSAVLHIEIKPDVYLFFDEKGTVCAVEIVELNEDVRSAF